jgi:hypothetical protein
MWMINHKMLINVINMFAQMELRTKIDRRMEKEVLDLLLFGQKELENLNNN